jgi:hypothetical protein
MCPTSNFLRTHVFLYWISNPNKWPLHLELWAQLPLMNNITLNLLRFGQLDVRFKKKQLAKLSPFALTSKVGFSKTFSRFLRTDMFVTLVVVRLTLSRIWSTPIKRLISLRSEIFLNSVVKKLRSFRIWSVEFPVTILSSRYVTTKVLAFVSIWCLTYTH